MNQPVTRASACADACGGVAFWRDVSMATSGTRQRRRWDAYAFPGFRPPTSVRWGCSAIRRRACLRSSGAQKNTVRPLRSRGCGLVRSQDPARSRSVLRRHPGIFGVRGTPRALWELRQGEARAARFLADNPFYTKRFAYFVGRRCRQASSQDVAKELKLDWHTVKELDKQ
jgi:Helix-turn-helix domain of transposase family ISL3